MSMREVEYEKNIIDNIPGISIYILELLEYECQD